MEGEKKYFLGLNADDDAHLLGENDYINAENIRWGTTDKGATAIIEYIGGTRTLNIDFPIPAGSVCIGGAVERASRYFVYCLYSPVRNSINLWDINEETTYKLIDDDDVTGSLGFSKDMLIHSARIVNDIFYWTDNLQNPRRINVPAAIKAHNAGVSPYPSLYQYEYPVNFDEITLIRRPPALASEIIKDTDTDFSNNFIANESFQFAYQYIYYDGEPSALGPWSAASRLNKKDATFNRINTVLPQNEIVPQGVRIVRLVVRVATSQKWFVVKEWDKLNTDDAVQIQEHNDMVTPLTFSFYNNISGEFIDDATAVKPFDSVPLLAGTLELARNRLFLGDNTEGYDTPATTSLEVTLNEINLSAPASVIKNLTEVRAAVNVPGVDNDFNYGGWYVFLSASDGVTEGYYLLNGTEKSQITSAILYTTIPALDPPPTSTSLGGLTFIGTTQAAVIDYILFTYSGGGGPGNTLNRSTFFVRSNLITVTGLTALVYDIFRPRSNYKAGVVFFDFAMRKCGVVTNDQLIFEIPPRDYDFTAATNAVSWTLSNTDALTEIPDWAYYYAPVRTLNLTTRFFIQSFDNTMKYATKDNDNVYEFSSTSFNTQAVAIGIDTTALVQSGLGYTFSEGDVAVLVDNNDQVYELPVLGLVGKYILVKVQDIGDLSILEFVYEIYTPYKPSSQEPFYEVGQMYQVTDPGTDLREYSVISGIFESDSFVISRNFDTDTFYASAMSPNDLYFNRWDTDAGRVNILTKEGQKRKRTNISFSNVFLPGTQVNGLSSFEALNEDNLPVEIGALRKLILASKAQSEGTVMLGIGENETCSIYLGETQVFDVSNNSFLAKSDNTIGQVNVLKGSYGTINPESVVLHKGNVYWFDAISGMFIRYSNNGLFPISNYKFRRVAKLLADKYLSMSAEQIEALGSRPFIFGGADNYHEEVLFAIPKLSSAVPKGTLIDYDSSYDSEGNLIPDSSSDSSDSESDGEPTISSKLYPYDIWDQQAKTLVFKADVEGTNYGNRWMGAFSFQPEWMMSDGNNLYSFENGVLFVHNDTTNYNTFYEIEYRSRLMFVSNQEPNQVKAYKAISIEGDRAPVFTHFRSELPYVQSSDLIATDFADREGMLYAGIYKDRLSPNAAGGYIHKMILGDPIKTSVLRVLLEFKKTDQPLALRFVNLSYTRSVGHKT
jgi:hypothetical protein